MKPMYFSNGYQLDLKPTDLIGEGGEAEIYKLNPDRVVKVFKQSSHPNFAGNKFLQEIATEKHKERQNKLPAFPRGLPKELVNPEDMIFDKRSGGEIIAYTMRYIEHAYPLLELSNSHFREKNRIDLHVLRKIFESMHMTIASLHKLSMVVGDLNSLNVLVNDNCAYFIDADSMQFGPYNCSTFCSRYADPLNCDSSLKQLLLVRPHNMNSDWYAFTVMLFECLLYVHPYGGVHKPSDKAKTISPEMRPLRRISVMHPEVQYPSAALPYRSLPDELLNYFQAVFHLDKRGPMPENLLAFIDRGSRVADSRIADTSITPARQSVVSNGGPVITSSVFNTNGIILGATVQQNKLRFVYWENGNFIRDGGRIVMSGDYDKRLNFKICGDTTLVAKLDSIYVLGGTGSPRKLSVDQYRGEMPVFDTTSTDMVWIDDGKVFIEHDGLPKLLTETLSRQTRIWTGDSIAFGYYQAGEFRRAFVFDLQGRQKINLPEMITFGKPGDASVRMVTLLPGAILAAECYFSPNIIWFLSQHRNGSRLLNRCIAIDLQGNVLAIDEAPVSDDGWLGRIAGKCGAGAESSVGARADFLLSAVNGGIVQIGINNCSLLEVRNYDAPSVCTNDRILHSKQGLYVWNNREIYLLSTEKRLKQPALSSLNKPR